MKRHISFLLVAVMMLSMLLSLCSCDFIDQLLSKFNPDEDKPEDEIVYDAEPTINGVLLSGYTIVYDEDSLDYNKRAAEYIKNRAASRYGITLEIIDDDEEKRENEIVVGETSRAISAELEADCEGLEFSMLAKDGSIAIEGDYFIIAAAAYFLMEAYGGAGMEYTINPVIQVNDPIIKEAKNYIMLIGDGMGVYQTRLFEYMENTYDFSDGEDVFYGYMLPYQGYSRTESLSGVTDSAAGGTALSCGYKTINQYIGRDKDLNDIKSLTELASELGKAGAVMSTETQTGATPASFSAHANDRDSSSSIRKSQYETIDKYGIIIDCGYDYYTASQLSAIDRHIDDTLAKVSKNEKGFFLMYEEAYIDKHCHNNDMDKAFQAVIRFNQAIARFMEFAFYNPDTFILITADHETGILLPDENNVLKFNHDDHSAADVLIFTYGYGADIFNGVTIENIQIAHTIAALMGDENFGDQSVYKSLTKAK